MDKYGDVWNNIEKYMENNDYPKKGPGKGMNAETLLKYHMMKQKIPFKQIKFKYKLRGGDIC